MDDSIASPADPRRFSALPGPTNAAGEPRRIGVEIEFVGLHEYAVAEIAETRFGGRIATRGPHELSVSGTSIGELKVYLDTAYRDPGGSQTIEAVIEAGRPVVPVEIVTEPLEPAALALLDDLADALRKAGARGTGAGVLLGLGLHFNIEVAAETAAAIVPVLRAFALLEDWLRHSRPVNLSRRVLPFVDPYPRALVDRLAREGAHWSIADLFDAYLSERPSRNRALDMLPILRHLDPARVTEALADASAVKARPAFHYRLPDCRIDEEDWSLAQEWNRWCFVERVAGDAALLDELGTAWVSHRDALTTVRTDWAETVDRVLRSHGVAVERA